MAEKKIKVLEIFSGAGGLSLGFDLVRDGGGERVYKIVLAVDNDKYACQTLAKYFKKEYGREDIVLEADLTLPDTHKKIIEKCKDGIDIIIGGPPCQSFSLIGPRSGETTENKEKYELLDTLYREYLKLVRELKPSFIVFENVKGILSKKDKKGIKFIDIITADFKELGYSFESENKKIKTDYIVLNAADYGVPQIRERVFLIGNNLGRKNPYPSATHSSDHITLFEAIGDLPRLKAKITPTGIKSKHENEKIKKHNMKINNGLNSVPYHRDSFVFHRENLDESGKAFLGFVNPNGLKVLNHHVARRQKRDDVRLFKSIRQGMTAGDIVNSKKKTIRRLKKLIKYDMSSFTDKYKKQSWKKPCSTVFAHLEKDGNRFIHPDSKQARTITVREAARIQSFPDAYPDESGFAGPYNKIFRQIGNAVPPLLALRIAESVYDKLGGRI
ncbi:MAG: DNA cytosine methyltransferase [Candidatus Omnitrophota bacterium]